MHRVAPSFIREILAAASAPEVLSLAGGLPRADLFPLEALHGALDAALSRHGSRALQYAPTPGDPELRAWIAKRLGTAHGIPTHPDEIMITTGSQQGLDLVGKLFRDDGVAMEDPGYLGAILAFQALGIRPIPLADPQQLSTTGAGLFYGMSRYQNPRGADYGHELAAALAEALTRHDRWMVEDDPYADLFLGDGDPPPTVASLNPGRVIYLGSFSKSVVPGLRLGYIRAPREILRLLEPLKQAADLHSSPILQLGLLELLTGGAFDLEHHLRSIRHAYRAQRDALEQALARWLPDLRIAQRPSGGMFLWARGAVPTDSCIPAALKAGVAFVPGRYFYLAEPDECSLRLNFSSLEPPELETAARRLALVLQEAG